MNTRHNIKAARLIPFKERKKPGRKAYQEGRETKKSSLCLPKDIWNEIHKKSIRDGRPMTFIITDIFDAAIKSEWFRK